MPTAWVVHGNAKTCSRWQEEERAGVLMDIFDFLQAGAGGNMISINIPRDDMKELIVVIAVHTAVIEGVLKDHHGKMTQIDVLGLENALVFGKTVVSVLSMVSGITQKELAATLKHFAESARSETAQKMKIHLNKSGEDIDSLVLRMFGDEGT
jgi:hypothetical protein